MTGELFPADAPGDPAIETKAEPGVCPICRFALLKALEDGQYALAHQEHLGPPRAPQEGDLMLCTVCTSLLVMAEENRLAIPTRRTYAELPLTYRWSVAKLLVDLENGHVPPQYSAPGTKYIAARGDHCVAGIRLATGQLMTSAPVQTLEEAVEQLKACTSVGLALEYRQQEHGLLVRALLEVFPGRRMQLGVWGPYSTKAEATEVGTREGKRRAAEYGFATPEFLGGSSAPN